MNNLIDLSPNKFYRLNPTINSTQLFEAVSACLCKAEALATVAATSDFESYDVKLINNYLWALSDLVGEARWLFEKVHTMTISH